MTKGAGKERKQVRPSAELHGKERVAKVIRDLGGSPMPAELADILSAEANAPFRAASATQVRSSAMHCDACAPCIVMPDRLSNTH